MRVAGCLIALTAEQKDVEDVEDDTGGDHDGAFDRR
jgi:hypothetical protein